MAKYEIKNIVHPLYRFTVNYGNDVLMYFKDHGVAEDYCALMNFGAGLVDGHNLAIGDKRLDKYCPPPILDGKTEPFKPKFASVESTKRLVQALRGLKQPEDTDIVTAEHVDDGGIPIPKEVGEELNKFFDLAEDGKASYFCGRHGAIDCKECGPELPRGGFF